MTTALLSPPADPVERLYAALRAHGRLRTRDACLAAGLAPGLCAREFGDLLARTRRALTLRYELDRDMWIFDDGPTGSAALNVHPVDVEDALPV